MATPAFKDCPLATCTLSIEERAKWLNVIDPMLSYGGSPGDWGYDSKLGRLLLVLREVRSEIVQQAELPTGSGA